MDQCLSDLEQIVAKRHYIYIGALEFPRVAGRERWQGLAAMAAFGSEDFDESKALHDALQQLREKFSLPEFHSGLSPECSDTGIRESLTNREVISPERPFKERLNPYLWYWIAIGSTVLFTTGLASTLFLVSVDAGHSPEGGYTTGEAISPSLPQTGKTSLPESAKTPAERISEAFRLVTRQTIHESNFSSILAITHLADMPPSLNQLRQPDELLPWPDHPPHDAPGSQLARSPPVAAPPSTPHENLRPQSDLPQKADVPQIARSSPAAALATQGEAPAGTTATTAEGKFDPEQAAHSQHGRHTVGQARVPRPRVEGAPKPRHAPAHASEHVRDERHKPTLADRQGENRPPAARYYPAGSVHPEFGQTSAPAAPSPHAGTLGQAKFHRPDERTPQSSGETESNVVLGR